MNLSILSSVFTYFCVNVFHTPRHKSRGFIVLLLEGYLEILLRGVYLRQGSKEVFLELFFLNCIFGAYITVLVVPIDAQWEGMGM